MTAPAPGPHGGDGARLAASLGVEPTEVLDLSASLNPCAPDLRQMLLGALDHVRAYPDDSRATHAVAEALGVEPTRVVMTNGGAEAIALVAQLEPVGFVREPEFSLYARHLTALRRGAPLWRSNPNNPMGVLAGADDIASVWDEAFHVLATGQWTRGDEDAWRVGSLTKAFACPGLRIGFLVVPSGEDPDAVRRRVPQWTLNGLAAAMVPDMMSVADPDGWARSIAMLRRQLVDVLAAHGLAAEPSDANYVVVRGADGVRDHLASRAIAVRDTTSFGFPGVRIAVPAEHEIDRLNQALECR